MKYCPNCKCDDCMAITTRRAKEAQRDDERRDDLVRIGAAMWLLSFSGASRQQIGEAFGCSAAGATWRINRYRFLLKQRFDTFQLKPENAILSSRLGSFIPRVNRYDESVEIPDPDYRGEPNPSPLPAAPGKVET